MRSLATTVSLIWLGLGASGCGASEKSAAPQSAVESTPSIAPATSADAGKTAKTKTKNIAHGVAGAPGGEAGPLPGSHPPVAGSHPAAAGVGSSTLVAPPLDPDGRAAIGKTGFSVLWPKEWVLQGVKPGMRAVQGEVPRTPNDPSDAQIVIYNPMGGDVEANIRRWEGQFGGPGSVENRHGVTTGLGEATRADFLGEPKVAPSMQAAGMPAGPKGPQAMLTAIIETDKGVIVFKLIGAPATVKANLERFETFVKSAK